MLENIPCLLDLKSTCLRERHWRAISEAVGVDIRYEINVIHGTLLHLKTYKIFRLV